MGYSTIANPGPELDRGSFDVGGRVEIGEIAAADVQAAIWAGTEAWRYGRAEAGETVKGPYAQDERGGPD